MNFLKEQYNSIVIDLKKVFRNPRDGLSHLLSVICMLLNALMIWKLLVVLTGCESPIVVVLSGSMEPGYFRGDTLALYNQPKIHAGDVVVYQINGRDIPIVHRILNIHISKDNKYHLLSKGDNNNIDDRGLYDHKQFWLENEHVLGLSVGYAPYVGILTIWVNEYPALKWGIVFLMLVMVLLGYE
ncbi:signal peptidase 21 kDa subunit, putative (SP21) [Plasmodium ovale wallikeri]|uniref:Signal peptidase complex catalytic subunit SEC11 n=2 Tax=Plasmodium ovale TaxID=36330 RepID=A0A1A8ZAV0_PLAOA|nr:signal peptidase 21 kDa subunit, putative (SP21) [Plasmodium ovale wallikeri]SBT41282.1 signal peptidase 21 kDa subunit, putative (SP21) [Plasmodium ovale wallikeri]SBT78117.1 signal peptidase 21 kDa subunit, putative [Plasmodium ovale]